MHITNNSPDPTYVEVCIPPGSTTHINTKPNPDMNAEQLARDIKSLPEAHKTLDTVILMAAPIGMKVERVVDELRKLRGLASSDAIRSQLISSTHKQLSRALPDGIGDVDQRAQLVVDELLRLREGSRNAIHTTTATKIHEQLSRVCDNPVFAGLEYRVGVLVDELLKLRSIDAKAARHNHSLDMMREALKVRESELAELQQKHRRLHADFKLLQAFSSGPPKGLAPEHEKWRIDPSQCSGRRLGLFRVMRGNVDATPHPVSEAVAKALRDDLNSRRV